MASARAWCPTNGVGSAVSPDFCADSTGERTGAKRGRDQGAGQDGRVAADYPGGHVLDEAVATAQATGYFATPLFSYAAGYNAWDLRS